MTTAFNAGTTNVITFGTSKANAVDPSFPLPIKARTPTFPTFCPIKAHSTEILAYAISGNPLATGILHLTSAVGLGYGATSGGDVTLWAKYAQTGTAATTGAITCLIEYAPNNDL